MIAWFRRFWLRWHPAKPIEHREPFLVERVSVEEIVALRDRALLRTHVPPGPRPGEQPRTARRSSKVRR